MPTNVGRQGGQRVQAKIQEIDPNREDGSVSNTKDIIRT
jgi:hypothetical protein